METSLYGGNEPEETTGTVPQINPEDVSVEDEMREERCDGRGWIKMENSQLGEIVLEETPRTLADSSQWTFPAPSNTQGPRWESQGKQANKMSTKGKNEWCQLSDELTTVVEKNHAKQAEAGKVLLSKPGRKYHYKSGLAETQEKPCLCPTLDEEAQQKGYSEEHEGTRTAEPPAKLSEVRKDPHRGDDGTGCPESHPDEGPRGRPEDGKTSSTRKAVKRDQGIQTEGRRYQCTQCGKFFRHRQTLTKHQKIHTGEKLHECLACGKGFTSREPLLRHQRIHTGEKPYECSQCGKCFRQRVHLMCHQKTHTGEKPFKCPECGRNFSRRDKLIRHQRIHRGQRPYVHSEYGKGFDQKAALLKHQSLFEGH